MGDTSKKPKKGAAKVRRLGRNKAKIARYYETAYPTKKLRNILKNNGMPAATSWGMKHMATAILNKLVRKMGVE